MYMCMCQSHVISPSCISIASLCSKHHIGEIPLRTGLICGSSMREYLISLQSA